MRLKTRCFVKAMNRCRGKLQVRVRGRKLGKRGRKARKLYVVASKSYNQKPGVRRLKIRISGKAGHILKKSGRLSTNVLTSTARTGSGAKKQSRGVKFRYRNQG